MGNVFAKGMLVLAATRSHRRIPMTSRLASLTLLAATLFLAGCLATTTFKAFDDGGAHYVGKGGAREVVDGVEIWSDGSPPRTYRVIGLIEDTRRNAAIPMASFKKDVAEAIRANGGAAGIILTKGVQQLGTYTTPTTTNTRVFGTATPLGTTGLYSVNGTATSTTSPTYTVPISNQVATVAVIRYVE